MPMAEKLFNMELGTNSALNDYNFHNDKGWNFHKSIKFSLKEDKFVWHDFTCLLSKLKTLS